MIASLKEAAEEATTNDTSKNGNKPQSSPSPTSWLKLKDPRIVRVSKAFGGKDRHSKVCTVRGLRDRRVRLSVPTAIQLYDLQDRLGLNQPSKAVDWLLNAAKHEIDELPPLPIPPGCFSLNHQMLLASQPNKDPGETTAGSSSRSDFWNPETQGRGSTEPWLNNSVVPFGSVNYQMEPQSFGFPSLVTTTHHGEQENNLHLGNFNFVQLPPTSSLSSSSPGVHQPTQEIGPRTISHLQMLSSDSQTNNISVPPFQHTNHSGLFTLNATQGKLINQTKDNIEYCYTS